LPEITRFTTGQQALVVALVQGRSDGSSVEDVMTGPIAMPEVAIWRAGHA